MKILNNEYAQQMKAYNKRLELQLSEYECDCYSNMLFVLNRLTDEIYSFDELFCTYDFFTDVLDGKEPKIDIFSHKDAFKGFYRLSKRYKTTIKLNEEQRQNFCFAIYWAACIRGYDETKCVETWNMECFENGEEFILNEFKNLQKNDSKKFKIIRYSDITKENYGLSLDNPIEVTSVSNEYSYLNSIETKSGKTITFERVGSFSGPHDVIVDKFIVFTKSIFGKKKKIAEIFITGYGTVNDFHTPKGFKFKDNE